MDFGIPSVSLSATHEEEEEEEEEEESQPPLKVFVSQFQNSTGTTNSFPIRALPSNDSDIETSIYIDQPLQVSSSSSSVSVSSSEYEGFVSGDEEFEIERRTFIEDPDEGTLEISNEVDDSNDLFVEPILGSSDFLQAKILMPPKARVSGEDEEGFVSEVEEEEEEEEEDGFSGVVRVSSPVGEFCENDNIVGIPKVRVLSSEKEEEEYDDDDDDDDEGEEEETSFSNVALEPSKDGFTGNDFMGNCKIIDEVSSNGQREDGLFVEVKRMCLSGLDTGQIELEENEFAKQKAKEVLVKTSTRFGIQSDQDVFDVDGCFVSKFVETDFGKENSSTGDINSEQNLEPMITNPAIEVLEQADFAVEEKDDCERKRGSFGERISKHLENGGTSVIVQWDELKDPVCCNTLKCASALSSILKPEKQDNKDEVHSDPDSGTEHEGSISDEDVEDVKFDGYESYEEIMRESMKGSGVNFHLGAESSRDQSHKNNMVMEFDKEVHTDKVGDKKDLFDPSTLAALPNAASSAVLHSGNIWMTSSDGSTISSVKHPACVESPIGSQQPTPRPTQSNSVPSDINIVEDFVENLTGEAKKRLETIQHIRVRFLRLLQRLGHSPEDSAAKQVLYQLFLVSGRQTSRAFGLETARRIAMQLEAEGKGDLDLALNILVLGKSGMGKSATINYLFGEDKTRINAFEPATAAVKEIVGTVHGVKFRVFDTPGLRTSVVEQTFNRKVLLSVKKAMKKCPPDIVLYVDRLDIQTRDLNDIPLLRSITDTLGLPIWESVILTLTHASSDPPDGPLGSPLSYEAFVAQRSLAVQHSISRAVGQLHMMNPVSLVENHRLGRSKDHRVLPYDQNWRAKLFLMCYSMKILSELNSLSKAQHPRKLFDPYIRFPPLPYLLSTFLQCRPHLKVPDNQGGDDAHTVMELEDFLESSQEEEDQYDQLRPFKRLRRSQIDMHSKEQKKAYLDEYDYRFKLLQKEQWKDGLKELEEMKKKRKYDRNDYNDIGQDQSTLSLSLTKLKGGLELRTNLQSQFSVGRSSKIAVGLGLNKHSGRLTITTSSSDQLQVALVGVFPIAIAIFRSIWPGNGEKHS